MSDIHYHCVLVKLSLDDIFWALSAYGLCVGTTGHRLRFSELVARGEATPLRGLRGVRNADDWPVGVQIGHSAVNG